MTYKVALEIRISLLWAWRWKYRVDQCVCLEFQIYSTKQYSTVCAIEAGKMIFMKLNMGHIIIQDSYSLFCGKTNMFLSYWVDFVP